MKKILLITLSVFFFLSLSQVWAADEDIVDPVLGPAPTESSHTGNSKIDSTGGLQIPGGLYAAPDLQGLGMGSLPGTASIIPVTKKALDPYRGPDVLNPCAYFETSLSSEDNCVCEKMMAMMNSSSSSSGATSGSGSTSSGGSSTSSGSGSSTSSSGSSTSSSSSSSSSSTSSSSSSSSSGGSVQCPPTPTTITYQAAITPPPNINLTTPTLGSPSWTECTLMGNTCEGQLESDMSAPGTYKSVPFYRVQNSSGSATYIFLGEAGSTSAQANSAGVVNGPGTLYDVDIQNVTYDNRVATSPAQISGAPCN